LRIRDLSIIDEIDELFNVSNINLTPENQKSAEDYFIISKADFNVFKLIYKKYPALGIYHLEQFHEKLAISFLICCGRAKSSDFTKHDDPITLVNQMSKLKLYEKSLNFCNLNSDEDSATQTVKQIIDKDKIPNNPQDNLITALLNFMDLFYQKSKDDNFINASVKKYNKGHKVGIIKSRIILLYKLFLKNKEIRQYITYENIKFNLEFYYLSNRIIIFYLLFFKHYSMPRYLNGEINYFSYPELDLTKKLDKIKEMDEQLIIDYNAFFMD
jgi:hypothetical protein